VSKQNLTRIVGIWWGIMLFIGIMGTMAQELSLESDNPVTVVLGNSPVWLTYAGTAGDTITITTLTAITDTAPDTTLEILTPDGYRLDYTDDVILSDGTIKSDAILQNIALPIDGNYRIRVDSFNGVSEGQVEVIITQRSETYIEITSDDLTIVQGDVIERESLHYTLEVSAGTSLSIIVRDRSGILDPILYVYDANDTLMAFNDDHQSNDLSLDVLDARLVDLAITEDTRLTIVVRDYLGRSGSIELIISS
jgi:hypothetical protein